jgi:hypothetical protein
VGEWIGEYLTRWGLLPRRQAVPPRVRAVVVRPYGRQDLIDSHGAGAMWRIAASMGAAVAGEPPAEWQVCCPGCGREVYRLGRESYTISGPAEFLSMAERVTFTACCGWSGWLSEGVWLRA